MTCQHHHDGAAYVLGALDPADRTAFEAHLPGCAECTKTVRGFGQLPGVLAHAPFENLLAEAGPPPPDDTLPELITRVRIDRRHRRWRTALVGAAAAVLVAAGSLATAELLRTEPANPPVVAQPESIDVSFAAVQGFDVQGDAALTRYPGGTQIRIDCAYTVKDSYLGGLPYQLVVTNSNGDDEVAGSWHAKDGLSEGITLFTRWSPENITAMEIQDLEGKTILRWTR